MPWPLERGDWLSMIVFLLCIGGGVIALILSWWFSSAVWAITALGFFGALLLPWIVLVVLLFAILVFGGSE